MDWKKRKQDLVEKLKYIGYSEEKATNTAKMNYNFFGKISGQYKQLEKDVNQAYKILRNMEEGAKRTGFYKEFKNKGLMN